MKYPTPGTDQTGTTETQVDGKKVTLHMKWRAPSFGVWRRLDGLRNDMQSVAQFAPARLHEVAEAMYVFVLRNFVVYVKGVPESCLDIESKGDDGKPLCLIDMEGYIGAPSLIASCASADVFAAVAEHVRNAHAITAEQGED